MADDRAALEDDASAIAWTLELIRSTPDIYLRKLPGPPAMATSLREELGIDSIGLVTIVYALADHFGTDIDERVTASWRTLGDVVALARRCAAP
jgi:acyl carrier protein